MAVTDLTGTTWILNDAITFSASLGLSNVISFNFTSNNTSFYGFYFDFNSDGDNSLGYRTNQAYSYVEIYNSSGNIIAGKEAYKIVTITGGTDVTNSALISWFESNATQQTISTKVSVDLTTLSGWESLSSGSHSITIVAKADGYKDSEPSEGVTVTKEAEADALAGTWVFNDSVTISETLDFSVSFTNDSTDYTLLSLIYAKPVLGREMQYNGTAVYSGAVGWNNEAYKTITITSKLSEVENGDKLLTWLQANATKQS